MTSMAALLHSSGGTLRTSTSLGASCCLTSSERCRSDILRMQSTIAEAKPVEQRGSEARISSRISFKSPRRASWCTLTKAGRAKPYIVAASSNEGDETKEASEAPSSVTEVAKPAVSEKRAQAEAEVKRGQRLAIVTGVISVLLGVGYLVLIQLLDTRGIILVPPPPEAFDP